MVCTVAETVSFFLLNPDDILVPILLGAVVGIV